MPLRGVLFDLYGTLIDIETDESLYGIYETVAAYLTYQGIYLDAGAVRDNYWETDKSLRRDSGEAYPEINVEDIWSTLLSNAGMKAAPARRTLSHTLAQLFRVLSRRRFRPFQGAADLLASLRTNRRLGVVSDAQICYALPEMKALGLNACFDVIVLSASHGFRKPDERLFQKALDGIELRAADVVYVGNDAERDVVGAHRSGMRAILVDSRKESGKEAPEREPSSLPVQRGEQGLDVPDYVARANEPASVPVHWSEQNLRVPDYVARDLADVLRAIEELSAVSLG
jgi:putative hydrolase of the HAD superfamily